MIPADTLSLAGGLSRGVLGSLFLASGAHKATDAGRFASTVAAYRLLPLEAAFPVSYAIIAAECITGALLLAGFASISAGAMAVALLGAFTVALAISLARGRHDLDCGCLPGISSRISPVLLMRNAGLMLLAVCAILAPAPRSLFTIATTILGATWLALGLVAVTLHKNARPS